MPRMELFANRTRFHLYDQGLVVRIASDDVFKYSLAYGGSWSDVIKLEGGSGRRVKNSPAVLTLPWSGGAGEIRVSAQRNAKPRVRLGKRVLEAKPSQPADARDGWNTFAFKLPETAAGQIDLSVEVGARDALVESVRVIPAASVDVPACMRDEHDALDGWPRADITVEVPEHGWLVVTPTGGGSGAVAIEPADSSAAATTVWNGTANGEVKYLSLVAWAGQLVTLHFTSDCHVAWSNASVAVEALAAPLAPIAHVKNVVLVVVDTLRGDHLAIDGPTKIETPRITAQAKTHGVVFSHDQAMAPSSPPSHATIQTGQIPRVHGATGDKGAIKPDAPVIASILHAAGQFFTGYVGNNDFAMARIAPIAQWSEAHTPSREGKGKDCHGMVERGLSFVDKAKANNQRFFISLLPIETHDPYRFHAGITNKYFAGAFDASLKHGMSDEALLAMKSVPSRDTRWQQLRALYDGEVEYFDGCYGQLLDGLAARGVDGDTAVVLTSDHGEGQGERGGRIGHAYSLNRELIDVPLMISAPSIAPRTIATATSNADIAPTILDLLGLPVDGRMQGESLLPAAISAEFPRVVASEYGRMYAIRAGRWHYLVEYDGAGHLYDNAADAEEVHDVAAKFPMVRRYMEDAAGVYLAFRTQWRGPVWGSLGNFATTSPLAHAP